MSKKNLSRFDKIKDTIKIEDFIIQYLNDGVYTSCHKLSHKQLKFFNNPYVIAISYEYASSNMELILSNKILLVRDSFGNVAPYINPKELKRLEKMGSIDEQINALKKERINQLSELIKLWSKMQVLLYEKGQIESTIGMLEEIKKGSKVSELGGESYVKKY